MKIDVDRMQRGKDLADKLRHGHPDGGIPWLVIVDAEGKQLVTSDGPKGNIGCPIEPAEIEHFLTMLRTTKQRATDDDLAAIEQDLRAFAAEVRRPR